MHKVKFIDTSSLNRDSAFNIIAQGVRKSSNSLFGWLAEKWTKRWFIVSELEMLDLAWFNIGEEIKKLK